MTNGKGEEVWIETTNGMRIRVTAVSDVVLTMAEAAVEREMRARGEPVDPPTYTVKVAGGEAEEFPHDETTLEVTPGQTGIEDPEAAEAEALRRTKVNRQAWARHIGTLAKMRQAKTDRRMRAWLMALEVEVPDDGWDRQQKALGIEVPEDPDERRHHYIITRVLTTATDLFAAVEACSKLTYRGMVKEEDIAAAMDSFRSEVEGATSSAAREDRDGLELLDGTGGSEGGKGLGGDGPEPVQGPALRGQGADHRRRAGGEPDAAAGVPGGGQHAQRSEARTGKRKATRAKVHAAAPDKKVSPDA